MLQAVARFSLLHGVMISGCQTKLHSLVLLKHQQVNGCMDGCTECLQGQHLQVSIQLWCQIASSHNLL